MTARKCEGCGRALRKSLGPYGPVCARKRAGNASGARTAPQGPRVSPALSQRFTATNTAPPHPGQTELPLSPMQPTLWSL